MTLRIRPVKLNRTFYFRVPNDIADLIGVDSDTDVSLSIEDLGGEFLLKYAVAKSPIPQPLPQRIQQVKSSP